MHKDIRNIAIIAHVDHGKTTLVDTLLHESKTELGKDAADELIMDSNELERERGITIFSKNASVVWNDTKINIIDTPGHADFGGEVERVLSMADGCLLLIDAQEGPMPQTRFVLKQALAMGHKVIVVVNKIDKPSARIDHVVGKTFDLFVELGASEDAAFFPVVYASAKQGKAGMEKELSAMTSISPVFDAIMEHIPGPSGQKEDPLQLRVTTFSSDPHKGRLATGRIYNGSLADGQPVMHIRRDGSKTRRTITSLMTYKGLRRDEVTEAHAGDIVAIAGIEDITIGETIADVENPMALPVLAIEEPTIRMNFKVNTSPFAGREGEFKTSRQIRERLYKATETDVALHVEDTPQGDWLVSGRGELHLAILIEQMRREGYEFEVSRPKVIEKEVDGVVHTPYETVFIEVPEEVSGIVMQNMGSRKAEMIDMKKIDGVVFLEFVIASRDLFGFRSEFITETRGLGIMNAAFLEYRKDAGSNVARSRGSLVAHETGTTRMYSLLSAQNRGELFVGPGTDVYKGQVVGRNARENDIAVNVCKDKKLTNHRSKGDGVSEHFNKPKTILLEDALEYIDDSELVEVTPQNVRIRKISLAV